MQRRTPIVYNTYLEAITDTNIQSGMVFMTLGMNSIGDGLWSYYVAYSDKEEFPNENDRYIRDGLFVRAIAIDSIVIDISDIYNSINIINSKIETLESNDTSIATSLNEITTTLSELAAKIDNIDIEVETEPGDKVLNQLDSKSLVFSLIKFKNGRKAYLVNATTEDCNIYTSNSYSEPALSVENSDREFDNIMIVKDTTGEPESGERHDSTDNVTFNIVDSSVHVSESKVYDRSEDSVAIYAQGSNVELDDVDIECEDNESIGIYVDNDSNVTINGGDIESTLGIVADVSDVTANDLYMSTEKESLMLNSSTSEFTDCDFDFNDSDEEEPLTEFHSAITMSGDECELTLTDCTIVNSIGIDDVAEELKEDANVPVFYLNGNKEEAASTSMSLDLIDCEIDADSCIKVENATALIDVNNTDFLGDIEEEFIKSGKYLLDIVNSEVEITIEDCAQFEGIIRVDPESTLEITLSGDTQFSGAFIGGGIINLNIEDEAEVTLTADSDITSLESDEDEVLDLDGNILYIDGEPATYEDEPAIVDDSDPDKEDEEDDGEEITPPTRNDPIDESDNTEEPSEEEPEKPEESEDEKPEEPEEEEQEEIGEDDEPIEDDSEDDESDKEDDSEENNEEEENPEEENEEEGEDQSEEDPEKPEDEEPNDDPIEPVDPEEPEEPSEDDPEEPETPDEPDEPSDDPEEPVTPEEPDEPTPEDPDEPIEPVDPDPVDPEEPDDPEPEEPGDFVPVEEFSYDAASDVRTASITIPKEYNDGSKLVDFTWLLPMEMKLLGSETKKFEEGLAIYNNPTEIKFEAIIGDESFVVFTD